MIKVQTMPTIVCTYFHPSFAISLTLFLSILRMRTYVRHSLNFVQLRRILLARSQSVCGSSLPTYIWKLSVHDRRTSPSPYRNKSGSTCCWKEKYVGWTFECFYVKQIKKWLAFFLKVIKIENNSNVETAYNEGALHAICSWTLWKITL